jgi:glycerophosphoryl diester phosphodiesterase
LKHTFGVTLRHLHIHQAFGRKFFLFDHFFYRTFDKRKRSTELVRYIGKETEFHICKLFLETDFFTQLPTLRQYLEKAGQLKTRLILELKSHKTPEQETRAVESIVKMVKDMGLENRMEYIAFSRHATKEFIRLTPKGTPVYYLEGDLSPKELKEWGCAGPDYHFSVFKRHPEWIKESHDLGMKVNAWTINDAKDMKWLIDHGVDFITTNVPVELQEILQ